jgi:hypothetical protein
MRQVHEVLRLKWEQGLSDRKIAQSLGISRPAVAEYVRRAQAASLSWPLPAAYDEGALERLLFPAVSARAPAPHLVPDWATVHRELKRKGVTLFLLWQEYKAATPDGLQYSWFCQSYRAWASKLDLVMRQMRQTEGFLGSVLRLMGLSLPCPDHTTLSRRTATVVIRHHVARAPQGPLSVIVDSTGLKVCGQGEWHAQKHGAKKCRRWKTLHLGVDDQGQIMASCVTDGHEQDPVHVPERLSQIGHALRRFIADGMYDQQPVSAAVEDHSPGAQVIVPPRKVAALSPAAATAPTQRDQHIASIERDGVCAWKRTSGYDAQSHAEHAFARYKRPFGGHMRAKREAS